MSIQINTHTLQAQRSFANTQSETAKGPQKPEEAPPSMSLKMPQDRAIFSAEALSSASSAPSLSPAGEEGIMTQLNALPRAENLAAAHSPISYERVMQLLE